jgi:hypothetical protein
LKDSPLNSELDLASQSSSNADSDSTTGESCGIDSKHMTRAALYARVSTDGQQKEGTIESQLAELRKQVTAAGHELVKEYIDDGYSGTLLDRPALDPVAGGFKVRPIRRDLFSFSRSYRSITAPNSSAVAHVPHNLLTIHGGALQRVRGSVNLRCRIWIAEI